MNTIIIFGAAERGIKCKENLNQLKYLFGVNDTDFRNIYFTDNNENLWNTCVDNISVIPPEELLDFNRESTIVIIASSWTGEIYSQVSKYGFKRLFCLDTSDSIISINSIEAKLSILRQYEEKQEKIMAAYCYYEAYKYISQAKYNNNTLFDEPFWGFTRHLVEFKNIHKGKRCFIFGNGPSLNHTDVSLIKEEITFGSNRVYKAFSEWGFCVKYWAIVDALLASQIGTEAFQSLPNEVIKFIPIQIAYYFDAQTCENIIPYNTTQCYMKPRFSMNPFALHDGYTITYILIQIAAIMGCNPIYLIGVDHCLTTQPKGEAFYTDEKSLNHFHSSYNDGNLLFSQPRLDMATTSYALAYQELSKIGREIYNASPETKLDVIPQIEYMKIFNK